MKRKTVSFLSTLVLGMGIVAGCSQSNGSAKSDSNANEPKVVTIQAQTAGAELTRVENLQKAAEKLN